MYEIFGNPIMSSFAALRISCPMPGKPHLFQAKYQGGATMPIIRIREEHSSEPSEESNAFQATFSFDNGPEYPITIKDPFAGAEE
jgi:hypothetical protein